MSDIYLASSALNPLQVSSQVEQTNEYLSQAKKKGTFYYLVSIVLTLLSVSVLLVFLYFAFRSILPSRRQIQNYNISLDFVLPKTIPGRQSIQEISWDNYTSSLYNYKRNRIVVPVNSVVSLSFAFYIKNTGIESIKFFLSMGLRNYTYIYTPGKENLSNTLSGSVEIPMNKDEEIIFYIYAPENIILDNTGSYTTIWMKLIE